MVLLGIAGTVDAQVITPRVATDRLRVLERELEQLDDEVQILKSEPRRGDDRSSSDAALRVLVRDLDPSVRAERLKNAMADRMRLVEAVAAEQASAGRPGSVFLTQAGFEGGTAGPQVSIDAAHLFFRNGATRMFVRSTLPTDVETSSEPADSLDERIKSALSDPYGGLLYLAVGQMIRLPGSTANAPADEGVFLDLRGGAKFVRLPGKSSGGSYASSAFGVVSAGIRVRQSLWTGDSQQVGMLEFSALLLANRAIDRAVSNLTGDGGELAGWPASLHIAVGLRLADGMGITLRGAPWTNKSLSKNFTIGLVLLK